MTDREAVGVVGLGRLGQSVARRMLAAGHSVGGYDPSDHACGPAAAAGVQIHGSPRELAAASDVCLVLVGTDDDVLDACVRGAEPLLAGLAAGDAVLICATVRPGTACVVAREFAGRGVGVLDAPLARGEQAVDAGEALALVGGDAEVFDRWRQVLEVFCADVVLLGDVGAGQVAKMVNNLLLWSAIATNVEGMRLARHFGLDLEGFRRGLLLGSGANWALETWDRPRDMPWADDDLDIVLRSCEAGGIAAPVSRAVADAIGAIRSDKLDWQAGGRTTSMDEYVARSEPVPGAPASEAVDG